MGGKALYPNPWQNEESGVVGNEMQISFPHIGAPSEKTVTASDVARRRRPAGAGNGTILEQDQILEMLTHRLCVAQVMEMLDKPVKKLLEGAAANLEDLEAFSHPAKIPHKGGLIDGGRSRFGALCQRIWRRASLRGKCD
jgi:hypothetical protein